MCEVDSAENTHHRPVPRSTASGFLPDLGPNHSSSEVQIRDPICPHNNLIGKSLYTKGSMSDDGGSEDHCNGGNIHQSSSTQSMTAAVTTQATSVDPVTPSENAVLSGRPHTKRGRALMKWVGLNYEQVTKLKKDNGEYFHILLRVSD